MADGRIEIDVITDDSDLKKVNNTLDSLTGKAGKAGTSIKSMVGAAALVKVASGAFNVLKNSMDGAVARFDTIQKFPKVMSALGFSAQDSQKSMKMLSDGIQGLPTKLQDVVAQTQQMASSTGNLDKSTQVVLGLNNAFLASGANAEDASRGMQQFNQMLSRGKVDMDGWGSLMETMPLGLQKVAESFGYAGESAKTDLYDALKEGTVTFDQFQDKIIELGTGTGILANLAKENSLGIATSFGNLKNSVVNGMTSVLTSVDKVVQALTGKTIASNIDSLKGIINSTFSSINSVVEKTIPTFKKMGEFIKSHSTLFKTLAVAVGGFVGAMGGMIGVAKTISLVKGAFTALKVAMMANPFTLIVGAVAALAAGFVYLYKTNTNVRKTIDNLFKSFGSLKGIIDPVLSILKNLGTTIKDVFSKVDFSNFTKAFSGFGASLGGGSIIQNGIKTLSDGFKALFEGVATNSPQLGKNFGEALKGIMEAIANALPSIVSGGLDIISGLIDGITQGLPNLVASALNMVATFITSVAEQLPTLLEAGAKFVVSILDGITRELPKIIESAASMILTFLTEINNHLPEILQKGIDIAMNILQGISNNIGQFASKAVEIVAKLINGMASQAGPLIDAGVNLVVAVIKGISNNLRRIIDAGMNLVDKLVDGLISAQGRLMDAAIRLINGFANNIRNRGPEIRAAGANLLDALISVFVPDSLYNAGKAIISGFLNGLRSGFENVKSFVSGIASWIAQHKGPISYDKRLLIPAGNSIMDGLDEGLKDKFKNVKRTIGNVTGMFSDGLAINLPKVTSAESLIGANGFAASASYITNNSTINQSNGNIDKVLAMVEKLASRPILTDVSINGKAVAQATSRDMDRELAWRAQQAKARLGYR